ncbi:twin-arginine translocase subunit TatC [Oerskovia sp. M15]
MGVHHPGLTSKERRYAFGFLGASVPLFLGGAFLAWWVLPHAVDILASFVPEGRRTSPTRRGT